MEKCKRGGCCSRLEDKATPKDVSYIWALEQGKDRPSGDAWLEWARKIEKLTDDVREEVEVLREPPKPVIAPSRKDDSGKLRYGLIPPGPLAWLAAVLTYGAAKYEADGWQRVPNAPERYLDALIRHVEALRSGEQWDPETGGHLHHCGMVLCNAIFLCFFLAPRDLREISERTKRAVEEWKNEKVK